MPFFPDLNLRHCEVPPGGGTCCTQMTEHKLALHTKTMVERNIKDNISKLSSVLGTRAQRFNGKSDNGQCHRFVVCVPYLWQNGTRN